MLSPASGSSPIRLSVVFCQYDRKKYHHALGRLIAVLQGFSSVDYTLAVVDNALEGAWVHEVSNRLLHVGGNNEAWEFSAFDRGVDAFGALGRECDIYAFVTDAFLAYGDAYLKLVDDNAVRCAAKLSACVGWIDSWGEECRAFDYVYTTWMRTSFFLMPSEVYGRVAPLAARLERTSLFGPSPNRPFSQTAPLSDNLRAFILRWLTGERGRTGLVHELWHSRFDLSDQTFTLFQEKAMAILREQLLSAKLTSEGIPCFDFRALRRLANQQDLGSLEPEGSQPWQWLNWIGREDAAQTVDKDFFAKGPLFVFWGDCEEEHSLEAARFYGLKVLPLVRQRYPDAKFLVLAQSVAPELTTLGTQTRVIIVKDLAEIRSHLKRATGFVAPLFAGPGVLHNILEAMECGTPVIGTRFSVRGLAAPEGEAYLRAESAAAFSAASTRLAEDPALRRRLIACGQELGRKHVD